MFDFVRQHNRILQVLLALVIFPSFVLVGIQGYSRFSDSGGSVAEVGGEKISSADLENAHRREIERMRAASPQMDPAFFDQPELKQQTLDGLIRQRVLALAANDLRLMTPDTRLQRLFQTDAGLSFLRNPDGTLNKDALAAQGMSPAMLEDQLRRNYTTRQVLEGIGSTSFTSDSVAERALEALLQQREVQIVRMAPKDYASKVSPTDADLQRYYDDAAHAAEFQSPEQADVEYVVLNADAIRKTLSVSTEDLRKYYTENMARFGTPEERRVSHILIKADASLSADDKQKARTKAQALFDEVRKNPAGFAELARQQSQDVGSAARGGDLDFLARGAMINKAFEDAAFGLKRGEIAPLVESEFGFHIVQLTDQRGGQQRPFEAVEAELRKEVEEQQVRSRFAEAAEQFSNTVYEQPDSLKPVAEKFKLDIQTAKGVSRKAPADAKGPMADRRVLAALFSSDNLSNKRNTEAVEVGPMQLVSARVLAYTPASKRPFAEVKDAVRVAVVASESARLAREDGASRLEVLRKGSADSLPAVTVVSRQKPGGELPALVNAVMRADAGKLPAWVGVDLGSEGYAAVRVNKVLPPDPAIRQAVLPQLAQALAEAEGQAYYAALRERYKVKVTAAPGAASAPAP